MWNGLASSLRRQVVRSFVGTLKNDSLIGAIEALEQTFIRIRHVYGGVRKSKKGGDADVSHLKYGKKGGSID